MIYLKIKRTKSDSIEAQRQTASEILDALISAHAPHLIPYEIARTDMDRPYIAGADDVDISISHTREYGACALIVGEGKRVGVDIEKIKKANLRVAEKYFTKEEYTHISSLSHDDAAREFAKLWTRYEAKSKYLGGGFADIRKKADAYIDTFIFTDKEGAEYSVSVCTKEKEEINLSFSDQK